MQVTKLTLAALLLASIPGLSQARDDALYQSFDAVVQKALQARQLDGSVKFYLAGKPLTGKFDKLNEVVTNKKTNAFNKSDEEACTWALQSALITLQASAKQAGANAVVDIVSFYKRNEHRDAQNYECHAGTFVAGVALKGTLAKLQ